MALLRWVSPAEGQNPIWWPLKPAHSDFSPQRTGLESPATLLLYGGGSGGGKGLALDTPIPTPTGFTQMGDLRPGDRIFSDDGSPCVVARISDVHNRPCFRVVFDDGTHIVTDDVHRWLTFTHRERVTVWRRSEDARAQRRSTRPRRALSAPKRASSQRNITASNQSRKHVYLPPPSGMVRSTAQIFETLHCSRGASNHSVPIARPLQCESVDLPIPPYTLGAWLGDGASACGQFTSIDVEIIDFIRADGFRVEQHAEGKSWGIYAIARLLKENGLYRNKHIPRSYMRASFAQRLALLQGLMDTDGSCDVDGKAEFTITVKALADGVYELACSLGLKPTMREGRATLNGKDCGPKWRVGWTGTLNVFRLPRKLARLKTVIRGCQNWRYIKAVENIDSVPTVCIEVDSPSHLFLAGTQMVPTHNSDWLVADAAQEVENPNFRGVLLRKSFREMNNIIDRMKAIYRPLGARSTEKDTMWRFPSGAQVRLGYMSSDADVENYQGTPFSWLGVDEAGNHVESRIRRMLPWLASTDPTLRVRARFTANPGGVGSDWLMRLFLRDKCPIHYPEESVEGGAIYAGKRLTWSDGRPLDETGQWTVSFIPALVGDNPLYGADKIAALRTQEAAIAEKLLTGCWCALAGRYFSFLNPSFLGAYADSPADWWNTFVISIDYGYGESWAAAGLYYVSEPTIEYPEGRMFKIGEYIGLDEETGEKPLSEDFAKSLAEMFVQGGDGRRTISAVICDPANDSHTGNGRSNMEIMGEVFGEYGIPMMAAHKSRIDNFQNLARMMKKRQVVITDVCPATFKSLNTRMHDPKRPGDIIKVKGSNLDDLLDETAYAANTYFTGDSKPTEVRNAERIQQFVNAGMDEHSLTVHRLRMLMAGDGDDEAPVRISSVGKSRVISRG